MNYKEAMRCMNEIGKRGSIFGLEAINNLLKRFDNPQNKLKVIHVAGTNGKGSICSFLEALYVAEGKQVGRYISPTLHDYLERFQMNGKWMVEEEFAQIFSEVYEQLEDMSKCGEAIPTAFEVETVIAFLYFWKKKVDYVILETGMGGKQDATNVVEKPLCTVFAAIGMDHMQFLGNTVEEIAAEKAGIMRDQCLVVLYPNEKEAQGVLYKEAGLHNANIAEVQKEDITILSENLYGSRFIYKGEEYEISLAGTYQIYNAVTAILCKQSLDKTIKKEALNCVTWEGRFQMVSDNPLFIKDGAHNIDGAKALYDCLQKHFTNERIIFIIGVLGDKEYPQMMQLLCPLASDIYTIKPDNPRGLSKEVLKETIMPYCSQVTTCENVEQAVSMSVACYKQYEGTGQKSVIIAWGSLSYIGLIRKEMID